MEHNVIKIESLKMKYLESVFIVELMMISIYPSLIPLYWAIDTTRCVYTMGIAQKYFIFSRFYANKVYCCFAKSISPGI